MQTVPIILSARSRSLRSDTAARPYIARLRRFAALSALICTLCGGSRSAQADLVFTLPTDPLRINAATGGTATFSATLTNNNPYPLYLNSDNYSIQNPAILDDTLFQNYFAPLSGPQHVLAANGGTLTIDLFQVSLAAGTFPDVYSGIFTLQGGANSLSDDNLATQQFAVEAATVSDVPETESAVVMALLFGLSGVTLLHRRRSCRTKLRRRRPSTTVE